MKHTPLHTLQAFLDNNQPTVEEDIEAFTPLAVGDYDDIQIALGAMAQIPSISPPVPPSLPPLGE